LEEGEIKDYFILMRSYSRSANLLTTVAPQQFNWWSVEPVGGHFWWFGSTIEPKGSIVEPTVNALSERIER
jgi:hypothetical protein